MATSNRILVTGGAGFIGSHLVERLLHEGYRVVVIDDCSTGSLANLSNVTGRNDLTIHSSKLSEFKGLDEITSECSYIFHLAAAVGVDLVVQSPIRTIRTNLDETEAVLDSATKSKTPVLLASTSEVYGKSRKDFFHEEDDLLIGPPNLGRWSYACSKLMDEFLAMAFYRERGLPVTIARFFNTVGPRQTGSYGMVLPRFVEAALKNDPIRIFGDGEQSRCFCNVLDTIEALSRLMGSTNAIGEVFNIGSTEECTIKQLAQLVCELLNSNSEIHYISYDQAYAPGFEDMQRRRPSIEKLKNTTGFRPGIPLNETVLAVAESIKKGTLSGA